jgi:hypothetical protein
METSVQELALLQGAYDIHIHCAPDLVPRAQDLLDVAQEAHAAGMDGIGLKDHTTCTAGRAYTLNRMYPSGPRFYGCIVLNPPVGGLNPVAVEAALRGGADMCYFPTYGARGRFPPSASGVLGAYPLPAEGFAGITVLEGDGSLVPEAAAILDLIAEYDAVLATGHLTPRESLALLGAARVHGVRRAVVTHASAGITAMSIPQQVAAAAGGAYIEHCFNAATGSGPNVVSLVQIGEQVRQVGVEHVILSSDFGQVANGPVVAGYARYLGQFRQLGFTDTEIRTMIADNPRKLLDDRVG